MYFYLKQENYYVACQMIDLHHETYKPYDYLGSIYQNETIIFLSCFTKEMILGQQSIIACLAEKTYLGYH